MLLTDAEVPVPGWSGMRLHRVVCPRAEFGWKLSGLCGAVGYCSATRNGHMGLVPVLHAVTTEPVLPASAAALSSSSHKIGMSGV